MSDEIVQRLRDRRDEDGYCVVCGDGKWESHFPECVISNAADEIQRLRKRNNYLRQELSATDYRKREQAEEIERLRTLITAWADADDVLSATVHTYDSEYMDLLRRERDEAQDALRKAVGP